MNDILIERPQVGPQEIFCSTPAIIAVAGGTFYSGKSISLLMEAGRNVDHSKYRGAIFRRTYPQITDAGGLADIASNMYPQMGGMPTDNRTLWTFPSGATIKFNHMQHDSDMVNYRASQFCFLGIDQLEEFPEAAFFYLRARNRPAPGYDRPAYCRCSCNAEPGWLADLIEWYWDHETGYAIKEKSGTIRYFLRHKGRIIWDSKPFHIRDNDKQINATSFTFISSTMDDNVIGMEKDPDYRSNIAAMDEVSAERYGKGNWKITYAGGMFDPKEFKIKRDQLPKTLRKLRYWDFAASEIKEGKDPANTASVLMGELGGDIYIIDCTAFQRDPGYTMDQMETIAHSDGVDTSIRWEEEKGSAGRFNTVTLTKRLLGFDAQSDPVSGQKEERAKPLAAATHNGRVFLVEAPWNSAFLSEAGGFPRPGYKKDRIDAASGALKCLCTEKRVFDKFTLSRCQKLEIDWSQASSTNIMYGAYYQAENSAIYFIAAIWDQLDAKLYVFDARRYDTPIPDKIALESIRIMRLKRLQNIRLVGNETLVHDKGGRSSKRVIKEAFNRYGVEWSVNTPMLYEIYGAIVYGNSLFFSDSIVISKDCQEAAAQIAGWTYRDQGKPNDGYEFGRCFCHLISDLKRMLDTERQITKKQDYVDVEEPVKKNTKSWELV